MYLHARLQLVCSAVKICHTLVNRHTILLLAIQITNMSTELKTVAMNTCNNCSFNAISSRIENEARLNRLVETVHFVFRRPDCSCADVLHVDSPPDPHTLSPATVCNHGYRESIINNFTYEERNVLKLIRGNISSLKESLIPLTAADHIWQRTSQFKRL